MTDPTVPIDPSQAPMRQWSPYRACLEAWLTVPGNSEESIELLLGAIEAAFVRRAGVATEQCQADVALRLKGTGWSFRLPNSQARTLDNAELWSGEMILGLLQEIAAREMALINVAVRSRSRG